MKFFRPIFFIAVLLLAGCSGRVTTVAIDGAAGGASPALPSDEGKSVAEKMFLPSVPIASGSLGTVSCHTAGFFSTDPEACAAAGQTVAITANCLEAANAALPQCVEFISSQGAPGLEEEKPDGTKLKIRGGGASRGGSSRSFDSRSYRDRWH